MIARFAIAACLLVTLSGCDVASEMAGDALADEVRAQYLSRCESIAGNTGIAPENVTRACECSADDFETDLADGEMQIDRARIEDVLKTCVQEGASNAPAEGTNG